MSQCPLRPRSVVRPGPVAVTFDTEAEAQHLANDTPYGLASGVFTRNLTRAHRMIRNLRAGIVWVNTYRAVSPIAPFGGQGLSGHGREGGGAGLYIGQDGLAAHFGRSVHAAMKDGHVGFQPSPETVP